MALGTLKPQIRNNFVAINCERPSKDLDLVINPGSLLVLETSSLYILRSRYILPLKPLDFGTFHPLETLVNMWEVSLSPLKRLALHPFLNHWNSWNIKALETYETL